MNRTESAVRMTHIPTGIVVQCQNERSQHKNRASAMKQMRAKLYEHEIDKKRAEEQKLEDSKLEINFGSQIRSYVLAPYRMIKDHRTKLAIGDVDRVLDGDIDGSCMRFWCGKTGKTAGGSRRTTICRLMTLLTTRSAARRSCSVKAGSSHFRRRQSTVSARMLSMLGPSKGSTKRRGGRLLHRSSYM